MRALQIEDEGELFNSYLDKDDEHYQESLGKSISESLGKSNALTYQNEYGREKISLSKNCRSTIYPIKLMKPNFIVDLMNTPGDLIPIGSSRAKLYCIKE